MNGFLVRLAEPRDADSVQKLLKQAFKGDGEARLMDELEQDGDLSLSLVADAKGEIVGHIAFSPLKLEGSEMRGHALAPLAVAPEWQGRGVGFALVTEGHKILQMQKQDFILVLGNPAYYGRFGYTAEAALRFTTPYDGPYQQALVLNGNGMEASGRITYAQAFSRLESEL